jgi:hypothetical protein
MSLEAKFMQAVEKLDGFKLQLVFQKKIWQIGNIPSSHACMFCKNIKLQSINSSGKSRLLVCSNTYVTSELGFSCQNMVQSSSSSNPDEPSWVLCKKNFSPKIGKTVRTGMLGKYSGLHHIEDLDQLGD